MAVLSGHYLRRLVILGGVYLAVTSCAAQIAQQAMPASPAMAPPDIDYIRITRDGTIPVTLSSNITSTTFTINGVDTPQDIILPVTNVAKIIVPLKAVTISAHAKCYPDIINHVQIGPYDGNLDINFMFSNADRKVNCEDEAVTSAFGRRPSLAAVPGGSQQLAWVIANSAYNNGWPALDFVENDKTSMVALLGQASYQVITSFNRSYAQLQSDETTFLAKLNEHRWNSVIIYVSGHGTGLNGENYFVPADAPAGPPLTSAALFPISNLQRDLRPLVDDGTFGIILVDACRSQHGVTAPSMVAADNEGVLVNFSTSPGMASFDGENHMSAWTERFVAIADSYPWLGMDQLVMYADRYTKWQSAASQRVQAPILYGRFPAVVPPFNVRQNVSSKFAVAILKQAQ